MTYEVADRPAESFGRTAPRTRGADTAFVIPDQVPDLAVDGFEGALVVNGLLRLNLVRFRAVPGGKAVREVVTTLTMSATTANAFAVALVDALNKHGALADDVSVAIKAVGRAMPEQAT
jgi:hypothetical protein